jgi:hypothetical protein
MPVGFEIRNGILQVRQSFDFPAVYLDHWAVRHFSSNEAERQRFLRALKESRGAVVVSHTNLAELTGPADPRHAEEAAVFFESVLPNVYFAMFDVQQAIDQEKQQRDISTRLKAPPDLELLRTVGRERSDDRQPFTIANIVRVIAKHRDQLGATWHESNQELADHINRVRLDPQIVRQAKNFVGHSERVPTLAVMQELLRPVFLDRTLGIDRNDAGDIHHAILSVVYCDYAMLDGKWEDLHERMKRRFTQLDLTIRTARVFSSRRQGVRRFLEALEATDPTSPDVKQGVPDTRL